MKTYMNLCYLSSDEFDKLYELSREIERMLRSRYEIPFSFFDPLVTAPYAGYGIQMFQLFLNGGLAV